MFDTIPNIDNCNAPWPRPLDELRAFADEHRDGIIDAAALLGGTHGAHLALLVLDGLAGDGIPTQRTIRAMDDLLSLLMLEHVHDPARDEEARFARIDPASACVEEICLLADGLSDLLEAYHDSGVSRAQTETRKAAA